jgi:phosphate acetyltransferase
LLSLLLRARTDVAADAMDSLRERARISPQRVVLPESGEATIVRAARQALDEGLAQPIFVGAPGEIGVAARCLGESLRGIEIVDIADESSRIALAAECHSLLPHISLKGAERRLRSPLNAAALLVAAGRADALVAGIQHATQDVVLSAMTFLGVQEWVSTPSSLMLMRIPGFEGVEGEYIVFADCGVVMAPDAVQLAEIALASAQTVRTLLSWEPRVAMLSFSTKGSAEHESVTRVREAVQLARQRDPVLLIDGEFQVDSAIMPAVASRKAAEASLVAGRANVLIFPDLAAGNIAYKCVQRFAKADAFGPFLQGFSKTVSDLSRGSSVADVVGVVTMASVHAQKPRRF